jgi:hypothetical protein
MILLRRSPGLTILWQIWRAQRWGLMAGWVYLAAAAITAQILTLAIEQNVNESNVLPRTGAFLAMPTLVIFVHLLASFSVVGSSDFQEKGFTPFMLVLPIPTKALAAWPIFWGCLCILSTWLFIVVCILRVTGTAMPMFWPATVLMLLLTLLQAVSWAPIPQNWLRIIIALPLMTLPLAAAAVIAIWETPEWIATVGYLAAIPLAVGGCIQSVAMARRGDSYQSRLGARALEWIESWIVRSKSEFHSPAQAQFWFEFRSYGGILPLFVGLMLPIFVTFLVFFDRTNAGGAWKLFAMAIFMPALFATTLGAQLGGMPFPFLATRPMRSAEMVSSKLRMTLASAAICYGMTLLIAPLVLLHPTLIESVRALARTAGPVKTVVALGAAVILPLLFTWKGLSEHLWVGLCGRPWVANCVGIGIGVLIGLGALVGLWVWINPQWHALIQKTTPVLLALLVALKCILATIVLQRSINRGIFSPSTAGYMILAWCALVAIFETIVLFLAPIGQERALSVIGAVVLMTPFVRLVAAPLVLDWNRHR